MLVLQCLSPRWSLSLDMLNPSTSISIGMQQRVASYELPSQLNIGASYDFNFNENQKLTVAGSFSCKLIFKRPI